MNTKNLGKHQKKLLKFAKKYSEAWHFYSQDSLTKKVVKSMQDKGLIIVNEYHQFHLLLKNM